MPVGLYTTLAILAHSWVQRLALNDGLYWTSYLVKGEIIRMKLLLAVNG